LTRVVLVRHADVIQDPGASGDTWRLSPAGEEKAAALTADPDVRRVGAVYTSPETKAVQTAEALAGGRSIHLLPEVRELDRSALGWMGNQTAYEVVVREILARPGESVRGCEAALAAQARSVTALQELVALHRGQSLAVVSHGILLTLVLTWIEQVAPDVGLWRRIRLPDVAVIEWESRDIRRRFGNPFD
jgi:broad specificity phosphatase PhoE